jgi:hypothetical protein
MSGNLEMMSGSVIGIRLNRPSGPCRMNCGDRCLFTSLCLSHLGSLASGVVPFSSLPLDYQFTLTICCAVPISTPVFSSLSYPSPCRHPRYPRFLLLEPFAFLSCIILFCWAQWDCVWRRVISLSQGPLVGTFTVVSLGLVFPRIANAINVKRRIIKEGLG